MGNIIIGIILLAIVAAATAKVVAAKRSGAKCIGCPHGQQFASKCKCDHVK